MTLIIHIIGWIILWWVGLGLSTLGLIFVTGLCGWIHDEIEGVMVATGGGVLYIIATAAFLITR